MQMQYTHTRANCTYRAVSQSTIGKSCTCCIADPERVNYSFHFWDFIGKYFVGKTGDRCYMIVMIVV